MKTLRSTVTRGKNSGIHLLPHRYADGYYVASRTKFERDYVRVPTLAELIKLYHQGFNIRMSNEEAGVGPSLIVSRNIEEVAI